jgi:type II secretory pathway component PulJ
MHYISLECVVLKQKGITVLELLIGLGIMSGVSLYTMKMTEEVETAVNLYQDKAQNIQVIKEKLKRVQLDEVNSDELLIN